MDKQKTTIAKELECPHCGEELEFEEEGGEQEIAEFPCPFCDEPINVKNLINTSKQQKSGSENQFLFLTSILEFCPWEDAESAIEELQELGDHRAIPFIQPFLHCPDAACYRTALDVLEKLGDEKLLGHVLAVFSDHTDRLPAVISFLQHSPLQNNEKVIAALREHLKQKSYLPLLLPFLDQTSLCKHNTIVPELIDALRDKNLDAIDSDADLRQQILALLGKTQTQDVLSPLCAHTKSLDLNLRKEAIHSLIRLGFDGCASFLLSYLTKMKSLAHSNDVLAGVEICEFLANSKSLKNKKHTGDVIEDFCRLFEQNASRFPEILENVRARLKKVMRKLNRRYPGGGVCFIATAAYGSELAPEVLLLREFRDKRLKHSRSGRLFIRCYEHFSPPIAKWIYIRDTRKEIVRKFIIKPIVWLLQKNNQKHK